jgi:paired amphipathic helix protein Sin3a
LTNFFRYFFQDEAYTLFYANSNWYYFVRLHAILCDRLRTMYDRTQILSAEEEKYKTTRRESAAIALRLKPQNEFEIPEYYPAFLDMLKSLLDGNMDATTYEDKLRDMYGIHAYIAFTLDRVSFEDFKKKEENIYNSAFSNQGFEPQLL